MISRLDLDCFKCFEKLRLPVGPLTLLSGSNASGKSTVLQALVLLHQTIREHEWTVRPALNGESVALGTVADVVDKIHGRQSVSIGLIDNDRGYEWVMSGDRSEMSMGIDSITIGGKTTKAPDRLRYLMPDELDESSMNLASRLWRMSYIRAERVGPRDVYPLEDTQVASVVGPSGEYAVSLLYAGRDEEVLSELALPDLAKTRLKQVEARMDTFFPGCAIEIRQIPQANALTLGIRTSLDTDFHRPVHSGFGLTQVLPIIIAALSADSGDILLIENPEVHLHPAGQGLIGEFLSEVASAGVQVLIETHSDHVLNGVRRAVKGKVLSGAQAVVHFFQGRQEGSSQVISPNIDDSGNIDVWPEGFFDQFDKDMNHFAGWGA